MSMKPDIEKIINSLIKDNMTGDITPAALREVLHKMSLVMRSDYASLFNGGFLNSDGTITHYSTGQLTPFFDGWIDPAMGSIGMTSSYSHLVIDGSIYFEATGSNAYKLCVMKNGVPSDEVYATLSSGRNNIQFRSTINAVIENDEFILCVIPIGDTPDLKGLSLIRIDMHAYGIKINK